MKARYLITIGSKQTAECGEKMRLAKLFRFSLLFCLATFLIFSAACGDDDDDDQGEVSDDDLGDNDAADDDAVDDDVQDDDQVDDDIQDDDVLDDDVVDDDTAQTDFLLLENDFLQVKIWLEPFGYQVSTAEKGVVAETYRFGEGYSLFYSRNFKRQNLEQLDHYETTADSINLYYLTSEADHAQVNISFDGLYSVKVSFSLDDTSGFIFSSQDMQLVQDEAIYGLMERIHWFYTTSESNPLEIGSINRRGQFIHMVIDGTISVKAPFYHSSQGYGLYVDTNHYGYYDLGTMVRDRLRFTFNTAPCQRTDLTYHLFYGPTYDEILDEYTALTGRPFIPPYWAFLHWRWRDDHAMVTGMLDGHLINGQVAEDVLMYEELDFPVGNYWIDRPWTPGDSGFAEFSFDPERLPNADHMRQSLFDRGYHLALWGAPWAIGWEVGQNGYEARMFGYYAPDQEVYIDLTNPDVWTWWKGKVRNFVAQNDIHGWKLDRGDEDHPSLWWNIYWDGRHGAELRNEYAVLYHQIFFEAMQEAWGDDFVNIARTGWPGSQQYAVIWGGDTRGTELGLRSAIISQLHCAFMGYPIWGSDTGGYFEFTDREVFARWLQFSAFCALMEIGGIGNHAPWNMPTEPNYDEEMIDIYRTYTELHHDMAEYIYNYAQGAALTGRAVVRPLVFDFPDDPQVREMWNEYLYGPDILAAPVWRSGQREREVYIPAGEWVDYWQPEITHTGPKWITAPAALDQIPFYLRKGTELFGRVW